MFKCLKQFEALLPVIPLIICAAIFMGADYYPGESIEEAGLVWHECRVSEATYTETTNEMQVERCFGHPVDWSGKENSPGVEEIKKPFYIHVEQPYEIDGKQIYVAKMGVKYFIMFDGHKIGPTFNAVQLGYSYGEPVFNVDHGQNSYVFRGVRNGNYYLVEITGQDTQTLSN
jgi:hypothetical protein